MRAALEGAQAAHWPPVVKSAQQARMRRRAGFSVIVRLGGCIWARIARGRLSVGRAGPAAADGDWWPHTRTGGRGKYHLDFLQSHHGT